jgi:6-carboxyhexanoate--CoA ligase
MSASGLFSVRMRAASGTRHLSGAERIVSFAHVSTVLRQFVERAWSKGLSPDQVVLTVEPLNGMEIRERAGLPLLDVQACSEAECRKLASIALQGAGVSLSAAEQAFHALDHGPSAEGNAMRGAIIVDARTGERLEPDRAKGVRVSRFDWSDEASRRIAHQLNRLGLTHFRTKEALALATKVAYAPGIAAELCWSDDPDYTAGYVASPGFGYVRLPVLKDAGKPGGGRAFFINKNGFDLDAFTVYLTLQPVVITTIGRCSRTTDMTTALF